MTLRPSHLLDKIRLTIWWLPSLCVVGAILLSVLAQKVDTYFVEADTAWYLFRGGPEGARSVLSTIASSMMTFTGVVFSVTILVLQLASSQFSPRVLRTFLRDRPNQLTLGIFVGTFVYSLLGLRTIRGSGESIENHVPALSVWLAVMLAILCVGTFIFFIHHTAQSIRAVNVLDRIGGLTLEQLDELYPEGLGSDDGEPVPRRPAGAPSLIVILQRQAGVVMSVDEEQLWSIARKSDVTLALIPMVGDFMRRSMPLFEVWGDPSQLDLAGLESVVNFGPERNMRQDALFGLRQIVDVAERALSPGVNDPTTAVQAIDQLHHILAKLVVRRFPDPYRLDDAGELRLVLPRPTWDDYLHVAVDEIRHYGESSVQVFRRLRFMLDDLLQIAPAFRRASIEAQLALLDAAARRGFTHSSDVDMALRPSSQGHGPQ